MRIVKYLIVPVVIIFIFNEGCEIVGGGTFEWFRVEYDYMYGGVGDNYDCLPYGSNPVFEAFKPGKVDAEIRKDDTLNCNTYAPKWHDLVVFISSVYNRDYPWYLQGGMAPESGATWLDSEDVSHNVLGYSWFSQGPNYSFALVFVYSIKHNFLSTDVSDACTQVTIHELGHEYAWLSDKYSNPGDHDISGCCVMDALSKDTDGYLIKCMNFCSSCVDSIKKIHWGVE